MKTNRNAKGLSLIFIAVFLIVNLIISGCSDSSGTTKSQRLESFISDLMAESTSIGSNFQGHPNAATVNYNLFKNSDFSNFYGDLVIVSQTEGSSNDFTIVYSSPTTTLGVNQTATGIFYDAGSGGMNGNDWFIYTIDIEGAQIPAD